MKFKIIAALSLLSIVNLSFAGIFFNAVPVAITATQDPLYLKIENTDKTANYPTFKKTEYTWYGGKSKLVDQKGTYPELTKQFIPENKDEFIFDSENIGVYTQAINTISADTILQQQPIYSTQSKDAFVTGERNRLTNALSSLNDNLKTALDKKKIMILNPADTSQGLYALISNLSPCEQEACNVDLYGQPNPPVIPLPDHAASSYTSGKPFGKPAENEIPWQRADGRFYQSPNSYSGHTFDADISFKTYLLTEHCFRPAYRAIQEFCNAIGVATPSITSYYEALTSPKGLAAGALIGAAAAGLLYKSQSGE